MSVENPTPEEARSMILTSIEMATRTAVDAALSFQARRFDAFRETLVDDYQARLKDGEARFQADAAKMQETIRAVHNRIDAARGKLLSAFASVQKLDAVFDDSEWVAAETVSSLAPGAGDILVALDILFPNG